MTNSLAARKSERERVSEGERGGDNQTVYE